MLLNGNEGLYMAIIFSSLFKTCNCNFQCHTPKGTLFESSAGDRNPSYGFGYCTRSRVGLMHLAIVQTVDKGGPMMPRWSRFSYLPRESAAMRRGCPSLFWTCPSGVIDSVSWVSQVPGLLINPPSKHNTWPVRLEERVCPFQRHFQLDQGLLALPGSMSAAWPAWVSFNLSPSRGRVIVRQNGEKNRWKTIEDRLKAVSCLAQFPRSYATFVLPLQIMWLQPYILTVWIYTCTTPFIHIMNSNIQIYI